MYTLLFAAVQAVRYSSHVKESDEEFDARYEAAFSDPNTDGWLIRKLMNDLHVRTGVL